MLCIVSLFIKAIDVANEEPTLYQRVLSGLVTYLVALMCSIDKNLQVENDDFSSKIDYACVLMKELIDQPVSMQEIAKKAGMGYSLFRKLFKEQKNYAPVQYFQNLKIQKAIELLTTTTIPVKVRSQAWPVSAHTMMAQGAPKSRVQRARRAMPSSERTTMSRWGWRLAPVGKMYIFPGLCFTCETKEN